MTTLQNFDVEHFLTHYWQKKPLLIKQGLPHFHSPITPDELAGLALEAEVESRLVIEHKFQSPTWILERGPFDAKRFEKLPKTNWTLLVQGVDRFVDEVVQLVDIFSFIPDWRFDDVMVSFATLDGGVGPHYDMYDVFLVQAQGKRRWSLTSQNCTEDNRIADAPLRLMNAFETEEEFIVEPGDVLYVPPRHGHWGVSLSPDCMTYSFGYRSYRADEMLNRLADTLSLAHHIPYYEDPSWMNYRKGLIGPEAISQAKKMLQALIGDERLLKHWFGRLATTLDRQAETLLPAPYHPKQRASEEEFFQSLQEATQVQRDRLVRMACVDDKDALIFFVNGEDYTILNASREFVILLASRYVIEISELLPYLSSAANRDLFYTLWSEGFYDVV